MKKKSARAWIRRNTEPRKLSPRREAERKAAGETRIYSSIAKAPKASQAQRSALKAPPSAPQKAKKGRKAIRKKPRTKAEATRIYGPEEFRDWIHRQPCAVCGYTGRVEQAHAKGGGVARKADWTQSFAACGPHLGRGTMTDLGNLVRVRVLDLEGCHAEQHRVGTKTFEQSHRVSLAALATETQARWQQHVAASPST